MYIQKAAGHLLGKALLLSHVVRIWQVRRHRKVVRCLTTECLSRRQKSDISHIFDVNPSQMCLYWRIVEACGLHMIKLRQSTRECLLHEYKLGFGM